MADRIVSCFCVVGTGNRLVPQNTEYQKCRCFLLIGVRTLTSVEIQLGQIGDDFPIKDNEKWIDLTGIKSVWLRCIFDQKEKAPITVLMIQELKMEDDILRIPLKDDLLPCQIKKKFDGTTAQFKGIQNGYSLYNGFFDLSPFLDYQTKKNHQLVLLYQQQSQMNFSQSICEIQIIQAEKIDKKKYPQAQSELKLIIPKDYQAVSFGFGIELKNRFLVYKQKPSPFKIGYMPKIIDRYPVEDLHDQPLIHMIPMIPMFCFPQGIYLIKSEEDPISHGQQIFTFILTSETGKRTYCTCLTFNEQISGELNDQLGHINRDNQFICQPKAICLLSPYNFSDQIKDLAKYIYRSSLSRNSIPIESTICNIVNKLRIPKQAEDYENVLLKYVLPSQDIHFYLNYKYPYHSNESLSCLFQLLDLNRIILLYQAILMEKKIHLISNHISIPGLVIDAFLQLLFPFEFTSIMIPVLPDSLRNYIEAPVPFMIGYSQKNIVEQNQHTQNDSIYVYLDTNYVMNVEHLVQIPEKILKKLKSNLKQFSHLFNEDRSKSYLNRVDQAYKMYAHDQNYDPEEHGQIDYNQIRNAFLELNLQLMKGYRKFLINKQQKQEGDFNEQFNVQQYLEFNKQEKEGSFLQQFVETRLFQYFIQERTKLSLNEVRYQFFDKCLEIRQKNKDVKLIKEEQVKKVFSIYTPEEDQILKKMYKYDRFPNLSAQLFQKVEHLEQDETEQQEEIPKVEIFKWPQYLLEAMYRIWFQFFIIKTRNYTETAHFEKLTNYAIFVVEEMNDKHLNVNEKIFRFLLESCGYFQMDEQALNVVKLMKSLKVEASPATHAAYFQAVALAMSKRGQSIIQQQEERQINHNENTGNSILSYENCLFKLINLCPNCKRQLYFEEILDCFHKNYLNNTIECTKHTQLHGCNTEFIPKMQVTHFQEENPIEAEIYDIYNPLQLLKDLEQIMKLKGETFLVSDLFEKQYKVLFINVILYMKLIQQPYFLMLSDIKEQEYPSYLGLLEKKQNSFKSQQNQNSILQKISKEFDVYKLKFDFTQKKEQESSSGSLNSSTRQEAKQTNFGSKQTKKIFGQLITALQEQNGNNLTLKTKQHQFQSLQQFDETKAEG